MDPNQTPTAPNQNPSEDGPVADPALSELDAAKWDITDEMTRELVERWAEATSDVAPETPHIPLMILIGEAITLASFVEQHFTPIKHKGTKLPGLMTVLGTGVISQKTPGELRELAVALGAVRAQIDRLVRASDRVSIEEAELVLSELKATLRFVLEGDDDNGEKQLEQLAELYGEAESFDEMAMALQSFADLADEHRAKLTAVSTFAEGLPAKARGLAFTLRERKAVQVAGAEARAIQLQKDIRDRLTGALLARMRAARKAFRFVFREHPDIIRQVTSAYERDRRKGRERRVEETAGDDVARGTGEATLSAQNGAANALPGGQTLGGDPYA